METGCRARRGVAAEPGLGGVRADQRHRGRRARRAEGLPCSGAAPSRPPRPRGPARGGWGGRSSTRRCRGCRRGLAKSPMRRLGAEHAGHGGVGDGGRDQVADGVEVREVLRPGTLEDDVHAGLERLARGLLGGGGGVVQHRGAAGGGGVGDDEPLEAPRLPERLGQEMGVLGGGEPADRVVGGHDRARPGRQRRAEGRVVAARRGCGRRGLSGSCRARPRRRWPRSASAW